MLARRFTIVCLLLSLFGMGLAILVAENSRAPRAETMRPLVCPIGILCGPTLH